MRRPKNRKLQLTMIAFAIGLYAYGCSVLAPQKDQSRYFVLVPVANSDPAGGSPPENPRITIGLQPIDLPRYLDRPEVITRLSQTEYAVSSTDRWGEPLDVSVSRILAQDLSGDLANSDVVSFPWSKKIPIDYTVAVQFSRLEKTADGKAMVQATWTIRSGSGNKLLQTGSTASDRAAGTDAGSASAALSEGIGQVSRDLSASLERLSQSHV